MAQPAGRMDANALDDAIGAHSNSADLRVPSDEFKNLSLTDLLAGISPSMGNQIRSLAPDLYHQLETECPANAAAAAPMCGVTAPQPPPPHAPAPVPVSVSVAPLTSGGAPQVVHSAPMTSAPTPSVVPQQQYAPLAPQPQPVPVPQTQIELAAIAQMQAQAQAQAQAQVVANARAQAQAVTAANAQAIAQAQAVQAAQMQAQADQQSIPPYVASPSAPAPAAAPRNEAKTHAADFRRQKTMYWNNQQVAAAMNAQLNMQPAIAPMLPVNTALPTVVAPLGASALMAQQPTPMAVVAPAAAATAVPASAPVYAAAPAPTLARQEEQRKLVRAERNRHSAAASRERKKAHLGELERRVAGLSKRNAQLQVEQIRAVQAHVQAEGVEEEIATLERQHLEMDMLAARIEHDLALWGRGSSDHDTQRRRILRRSSSWDGAAHIADRPFEDPRARARARVP